MIVYLILTLLAINSAMLLVQWTVVGRQNPKFGSASCQTLTVITGSNATAKQYLLYPLQLEFGFYFIL